MPLAAAKKPLQLQIEAAFIKVMKAGEKDGANPEQIIKDLSIDLANAIHTYTTQALVTTTGGIGVLTGVAAGCVPPAFTGPVTGAALNVAATGTLS